MRRTQGAGSRAEAEGPAAPGGRADCKPCLQSPRGRGAQRVCGHGGLGGRGQMGPASHGYLAHHGSRPAPAPGARGTGTSDTQLPARQQGQSPAPVNWRRLTWRIRSLLMHPRCAHGGREGPSDGAEVTQLGNDRGRPGPGPAGTLLQAARWAPKVWGSGSGLGLQRQ